MFKFLRAMVIASCLLTFMDYTSQAQEFAWQVYPTGSQASLRGVAAAPRSDQPGAVIWASGANGTVLRSLDMAKSWTQVGPTEFAQVDFRSIHAWNENAAIIASAGTPAVVLKTNDGGATWREVFRDPRPAAFFDGLKFIDHKRGVLFGDPIDSKFCVFTTIDAGESWQAIDSLSLPEVLPGEAAFAASNSAMIVAEPASILIGTGGAERPASRLMQSSDFGKTWRVEDCPIASNKSSGVFSLALNSTAKSLVAVGGDYQPDAKSIDTSANSHSAAPFTKANVPLRGYRSAVVFSQGKSHFRAGFYATGPTGTDYSETGTRWEPASDTGFHALAVLPDKGLVAVGSDGRCGLSK